MNGVVIVAAGTGSRMKMDINKQFIKLNDKEIIAYTIEKFYENKNIQDIVVVIKEEEFEFFKSQIISKYGFENIKIAFGGNERQDSVYNGLKALDEKCKIVLIHDGARPFVSEEIIANSITEAINNKAVVVGVSVKDTIKVVDSDNNIVETPDRSKLWAVQTPQTFVYQVLLKSYEDAFKDNFYGTDDAMLVERIGYKVKIIQGSYNNIKITTQEDLNIGTQILKVQNY
ncbi:MAG: 2-C-methyl-D-erythritol 4-phosphate cytidylyltransferase [Romboutsia sp.]|uniref:2-C-methyl-D-erythritol 4-phosphate cytidylyltransferase n=1 Tax=Romboutsia sp. TaxID=1965302 RepID=UPI003F3D57F4